MFLVRNVSFCLGELLSGELFSGEFLSVSFCLGELMSGELLSPNRRFIYCMYAYTDSHI